MGVNKVILLGNLGADPDLRYTNSQMPVCNLKLATGERRKQGNDWVDHTEWHTIVTFGKTAEHCKNYLKKGRQVYVEGRIQTRKWQDKEGKDRWSTEIVANTVQFIGSGAGKGAPSQDSEAPSQSSSSGSVSNGVEVFQTGESSDSGAAFTGGASGDAGSASFSDDDIPF